MHALAPSLEYCPAGHGTQVLLFLLPSVVEYVPAAHGCGMVKLPLQKKPAEHWTHDAVQLEKKYPGTQP